MNYLRIISIVVILASLGAIGVNYFVKSKTPAQDKRDMIPRGEVSGSIKTSTSSKPTTPSANTSTVSNDAPTALSSWSSYLSTSGNYTSSPWAGTIRNRISETEPANVLLHANILMVESQGLESARQQSEVDAYMKAFIADKGVSWREGMYSRTISLISEQKKSSRTFSWQIGNEINSIHFRDAFNTWSAANPTKKLSGDPIIPYFVEYYLAPSIEGIHRAEAEMGVDVPVALGSIAGAYNPNNRKWLDDILSYKITGTYAPTLAGKKVSDIIEIATIHYLVSSDDDWENSLNGIWDKWIGVGSVRGLWSTEELGKKAGSGGEGAEVAMRVFARYNSWWIKKGIDSEKGLASFWGPEISGPAGNATNGNYSLGLINNFWGNKNGKIIDLSSSLKFGELSGTYESYLFGNTLSPDKALMIIFPRRDSSVTLSSVSFGIPGWDAGVSASAHTLSSSGDKTNTPSVEQTAGLYSLNFQPQLSLQASGNDIPVYVLLLTKN